MSGVTTLTFRQELLAQRFLGIEPVWDQFEVALTRRVPTTNSSVDQLDEPVGAAYARQQFALSSSNFSLINENEIGNNGLLYFPTATGAWGSIHGWAVISQKVGAWPPGTGPKVMAVGTLNEPIRVVSGVRPYLGPGSIVFGLYD